jgi:hypothetical protein
MPCKCPYAIAENCAMAQGTRSRNRFQADAVGFAVIRRAIPGTQIWGSNRQFQNQYQ